MGRTAEARAIAVAFTTVAVALPAAFVGVIRTNVDWPTVSALGLPAVPVIVTLVTPEPTVVAVVAMFASVD